LISNENSPSLVLKIRVMGLNHEEWIPTTGKQRPTISDNSGLQKILDEACAAYDDFGRHGNIASLDQAISQFQVIVVLAAKDSPKLPELLNYLGLSLHYRFKQLGQLPDIDSAVARFEEAIALAPDIDPGKPIFLNNLGNSLEARFEKLGSTADINNAISRKETALDLTLDGHEHKPMYLNSLGRAFHKRFERFENVVDIDCTISKTQAAVDLTSDDHPDKPMYLHNLGLSLQARFGRVGDINDINRAISQQRASVDLTPEGHSEKPAGLNNLGLSFRVRSERLGSLDDIDTAILLQQTAVDLTRDDHPDKPSRLSTLGTSFLTRFELLGELADIDRAISLQQNAVNARPNDPSFLNSLGHSLHIRFRRLGNIADVDRAISQHQMAADLIPSDHPDQQGRRNNLSGALLSRFQHLGNLTDVHEAIIQQQQAIELTPDDHPFKPRYLSNLGNCFTLRYEWLGDIIDLDHAISQYQAAVDLSPDDDWEKPTRLSNLGISLESRFKRLENIADIDNAISRQQEAVSLTPASDPRRPRHLANFGKSLQSRFERTGNIANLDQAISELQVAADLAQDGNLEKSPILLDLANSLRVRFDHLHNSEDAELAISHFSAAASSQFGPPRARFSAASAWISIASLRNHQSLLDAYECALDLIPLLAWLGLPIQDRHKQLINIGGIAREAASAAISAGEYEKALEWLEQGRSIVWTQILRLRTPVDQLRNANPDLADRLLHVSRLLDQMSGQNLPSERDLKAIEEQGRQHRASTAEWESIIEQVRALPNFEDFLKPPDSSRLINAAQNGPAVILNIAEERCDALALIAEIDEVIHIPLPNITSSRVGELQVELKGFLNSTGIRMRGERAAQRVTEGVDDEVCKGILAELWTGLVKPVLDSLAFSVSILIRFESQVVNISSLILTSFLASGGVRLGHLHSFLFMQPVFMTSGRSMRKSVTMSYHPIYLQYPLYWISPTLLKSPHSGYYLSYSHQLLACPPFQAPRKSGTTFNVTSLIENTLSLMMWKEPRGML
jgi:tetratricopeptide (TPR) repeat protein